MSTTELQVKLLSSMAKVFPNKIAGEASQKCRTLHGQEIAFQAAYRLQLPNRNLVEYNLSVSSPIEDRIQVFAVETVPSLFPVYPASTDDGNYITRQAGLFPDPLIPMVGSRIRAIHGTWRALWFSVKIDDDIPAGEYPVEISFTNVQTNETVAKAKYCIQVENYTLPEQKLLFTQWFHCDCIADVHHVSVFSEKHWDLIEKYMRLARTHGMNMVLTPVVTPPLDTAVGGERPTVQLVDVEKTDDGFRYDCSKLRRFIKIALDVGMIAFEINHFFTQWGAGFAPKVVAKVNGRKRRIFGWDTPADDPAYAEFLRGLVPTVIACFESEGVRRDQLWFHVSDEPHEEHLEQYAKAGAILKPLINGCHHLDALSSYEFYQKNLVERPVVATDHIGAYLNAKVENLWCYYCCGQGYKLSNRFFAMPSPRNRMLGIQLYKHNIAGFLHWGYNFYYSEHSKSKLDPYAVTDAGAAFPSGDAFSVYPYKDSPTPSLRQKVFSNGLEDIRLLQLLEQKIGRSSTLELLERVAGMEITFTEFPHDEAFFNKLYDAIFEELNSAN